MPLSALAELVIQPVVELVLHVLGYLTGVVVVPAFTLGLWRVEGLAEDRKRRVRPKVRGMRTDMTGPRIVSADAGAFFGLLFWALLAVGWYFLYRW